MKNRLLQAMKSLPMLAEDKEKFVNEIGNISNNGSGGTTSKYAPRYFTIDWSKADSNWERVLWFEDTDTPLNQSNAFVCIASSYKHQGLITSHLTGDKYDDSNISFSYIPLYVPEMVLTQFGIDAKPGIQSFEDIINLLNKILPLLLEEQINLSMEGITEITEEEFYNFD